MEMKIMRHGLFANTRIGAAILAGCTLAATFGWTAPTSAADAPPKPLRPSARGEGLTDEQVVQAMHRAIDYLLAGKSGDNFESGRDWPFGGQHGGETAIVLYALLNAGASLGDDKVYSEKLDVEGKEIAPIIKWLSQVDPQETYTAGLMASALVLVPKKPDEKIGEGPQAGLERDKFYLLSHMGVDGGYTYGFPRGIGNLPSFLAVFEKYFNAKTAVPPDQKAINDARGELDNLCRGLRETLGGPDAVIQHTVMEMNYKAAKARKAGDNAAAQKIDMELRELQIYYSKDMPRTGEVNLPQQLNDAQKDYANAQKAVATNNPKLAKQKWNGQSWVDRTVGELPDYLAECKRNLEKAQFESYNHFAPIGDLSNGQYGTLGSWALCDYGIEYPMRYWQVQNKFWRLLQREDGGWAYATDKANTNAEQNSTKDTMTAAGVASLYVAEEFTDNEIRLIPKEDKNIEKGVGWLTSKFDPHSGNLYYLYGVERVGLASGLKFFGTQNWYKEAGASIVAHQNGDGSFQGGFIGSQPRVTTAYGLLFLARGRNPVVFNKLQYDGYWNARPRDDANITRWMSKQFEKPINWQVVNLKVNPEEWLDAPVLLITGSKDPKFTPADMDKLRAYVHAGGIIFSTADGQSIEFTKAMQKYAVELVHGQYEMKELPRSHQLFSKSLWADAKNPPKMMGMSNGVRELWIHSTADMGASWQARKTATPEHFTVPSNLYFYATGKGTLRSKLSPLVVANASGATSHTIALARVEYAGNFDPEPGAWPRAVKLARADFRTDLQLSTVKVADLDAKKTPTAHLTGTSLSLGAADVAALKKYLNDGGFLFADAAGGKTEFANGFYALAKQIYPGAEPTKLPADHPIITGSIPDGQAVGEPELRKYARLTRPTHAVDLEAIIVNGKIKMLFSPYDITSGLLGTQTWGIIGYVPDTAETLVQNILLWSQNQVGNPSPDAPKTTSATNPPIPNVNLPSLK
jgi:hypothetical protein